MYISYCGLLYFLSVYVFVYSSVNTRLKEILFIYLFYKIFPIARPCA